MAYEEIVQAFSRTNRLYGPEKPFGSIRYYRKIHTMSRNIQDAFRLYSGSVPEGLYADKKRSEYSQNECYSRGYFRFIYIRRHRILFKNYRII